MQQLKMNYEAETKMKERNIELCGSSPLRKMNRVVIVLQKK